MLVKLNLSLFLPVLILNHLSLSLIFDALVLARSLTSLLHYPSSQFHSHSHTLSAATQSHCSRSHSRYHFVLALTLSFSQSLLHCHSRSLTLTLSVTHERLVFYKCLFLCLVLMVMISEKLGLILGFDDFQFSF